MDSSTYSDEDKKFYRKIVAYRRVLWTINTDEIDQYYFNENIGISYKDDINYLTNFRNGYKARLLFHPFLMENENSNLFMVSRFDKAQEENPEDKKTKKKYDEEYPDERSYEDQEEDPYDYDYDYDPFDVKCFIVKDNEKEEIESSYPGDNYDDCYRWFEIEEDKTSKYSVDNQLNLIFEIKLMCKLEKIKFQTSFEKFYNEECFNNFKIICCDGVEVPANTVVLAQFSPVLETMFKSNLLEMKSGAMKLDDLDGDTMKEFVKFLYIGKVDHLKQVVFSLMYAAEKYEVTKLKEICVAFMKDNLSVENVIETFNVAELCNVKGLRAQCIEFMKFQCDLLKDSPGFNKLNQDLLNEIVTEKGKVTSRIVYVAVEQSP